MLQLKERFALRVLTDDRLVFFHVPPDDISAVEIAEQIILKDGLFRYAKQQQENHRGDTRAVFSSCAVKQDRNIPADYFLHQDVKSLVVKRHHLIILVHILNLSETGFPKKLHSRR